MYDEIDTDDLQINTAHRVILTKVNDKGDQQLVDYKGLAGEEHTEVLRVQPFGFSSHPPKDSEAIVASLGTRDMPVVLGAEHPDHRPKDLKEGAAKLYDKDGAHVHVDGEGNTIVKTNGATIKVSKEGAVSVEAGQPITLKGPGITLEGPMTFKGDIAHEGNLTSTGNHVAAAHV